MNITDLSPTQIKVLSILHTANNNTQLAGNGRAPLLSAARALMRKGVVGSYLTGCYYLRQEHTELARLCWESRAEIRAENKRLRDAGRV